MKAARSILIAVSALAGAAAACAQGAIGFPKNIEAGSAFSVMLPGSGEGTLYIVGPDQVLKREVALGQVTYFPSGLLCNAGHYLAFLGGSDAGVSQFDVSAASKAAELSFLAKPSRLPVGVRDGISGAVYVFDGYRNLVSAPLPVEFALTNPAGAVLTRSTVARYGAASTLFDSTPQQGTDRFVASADGVSSTRIVRQVPGDPCAIKMNASQVGSKLQLTTEPVRDCSGNAIPDGTIVTFTQSYNGAESTVDVPLKRGIAEVQMPDHPGATVSAASGVVLGNQIRWEK